jgi:SAM-dependent methyltransferase
LIRTETSRAERTFNDLWRSADAPPWDVRSTPIEIDKIELLLPHLHGTRSTLDLACGGGDFLDLLAARADLGRVVGVDIADNALRRAERTGRYAELVRASLQDTPAKVTGEFDLVLLGEVLYYLRDHVFALAGVTHYVAPGGLLFIALAMGPKMFGDADVEPMLALLARRGLDLVEDAILDYRLLGIPRRKWPFSFAYHQTHKRVLLLRRAASEVR